MADYVTDTQALVKFMMGKKVINDKAHRAFLSTDKGESTIIIPAVVLMEVLYLFEKNRISINLIQTEDLLKSKNYQFEPLRACEKITSQKWRPDLGQICSIRKRKTTGIAGLFRGFCG